MFYIGSTGNLHRRRIQLFTSLRSGKDHNPKLQALFNDDNRFTFSFTVTEDRDTAYDLEQLNIDRLLSDPSCVNINNNARSGWDKGTMPRCKVEALTSRNTEIHSGKKYRKGMKSSDETRQRLSESVRASWDIRGRVEKKVRPPRYGARGRIVQGKILDNMRKASVERGIKQSRSVMIDGVLYHNATYAAIALGFSRRTIIVRIADDRYPTWKYTD